MEGLLDMVNNVTGGEGLFDGMKEIVANAETGTINRSIEMLQSHRSRAREVSIFRTDYIRERTFGRNPFVGF